MIRAPLARVNHASGPRARDDKIRASDALEVVMPLSHIEHFLVATDDIEKTGEWYCRVLGMKEGPHPDFGFPVKWLYLNNVDVVHITQSAKSAGANQKQYLGRTSQDTGTGTGALDHIAFRATGLKPMMAHLKSLGIQFNERRANGQALYQLFMFDPNGIKIELNYDAAEVGDANAEVMASDFARG
jgi:catechol 2,3-dioxygenase-like lactoylglutathione lyase family enzyme